MNVAGTNIVMGRHYQMRKHGLSRRRGRRFRVELGKLAEDLIWAHVGEHIQLPLARGFGAVIREVDDDALIRAFDGRMRLVHLPAAVRGPASLGTIARFLTWAR